MKLRNLSKIAFATVFGLAIVGFTNVDTLAQGNSRSAHERNRIRKQKKEYEKAQKRAAKQYYRVYRGGSDQYYETDHRGAELLRQAVNQGYRQGYEAGRTEARYRRNDNYRDDRYYRSGTYGYQSYVDRSQYQYYFRQGYERGYNDGYNNQSRYGYQSGGNWNILGSILSSILNIRQY
jgi:flagellar biosynthesis/type III secretory pathway protein FliH